ncbi:putative proline-rich receptor-like protein kinase PERK13 [Iris pallida]|uniref:Proline-rich receptor-like protein kinase PERK13 n=1 Tax=Iris pallida TaxID=29817 RepID=A0AAX6G5X2_IRIPA|nr:putative proline-rich receptor-like protein kinase PERK13 [Iris pallida]
MSAASERSEGFQLGRRKGCAAPGLVARGSALRLQWTRTVVHICRGRVALSLSISELGWRWFGRARTLSAAHGGKLSTPLAGTRDRLHLGEASSPSTGAQEGRRGETRRPAGCGYGGGCRGEVDSCSHGSWALLDWIGRCVAMRRLGTDEGTWRRRTQRLGLGFSCLCCTG